MGTQPICVLVVDPIVDTKDKKKSIKLALNHWNCFDRIVSRNSLFTAFVAHVRYTFSGGCMSFHNICPGHWRDFLCSYYRGCTVTGMFTHAIAHTVAWLYIQQWVQFLAYVKVWNHVRSDTAHSVRHRRVCEIASSFLVCTLGPLFPINIKSVADFLQLEVQLCKT